MDVREKTLGTAEHVVGIRTCIEGDEVRGRDPPGFAEVNAGHVGGVRGAVIDKPLDGRARRDERVDFGGKGLAAPVSGTVDEPDRPARSAFHGDMQHREHRRHTDPGADQHQRAVAGRGLEGSRRPPRHDRVAHSDLIVEEARGDPPVLPLDADTVMPGRWAAGQRIAAPHRARLSGHSQCDRQMHARLERRQRPAVPRGEMKRGDGVAFGDLVDHRHSQRLDAVLAPAQRQGTWTLHHAIDRDADHAPRLRIVAAGRAPVDPRPPGDMQKAAGLEGHEQQPDPGVADEIADRVEEIVAGVVGDLQGAVRRDLHETRLAAAMGGIEAARRAAAVGPDARADEERIRRRDPSLVGWLQPVEVPGGRGLAGVDPAPFARVDVLRAIAEALVDIDDIARPLGAQEPVQAVAAAAGQRDAEHADLVAGGEGGRQRVRPVEAGCQPQLARVRRGGKAFRAFDDRDPGLAGLVAARDDEKRQRRKEGLVLLGHPVADEAGGRGRDVTDAGPALRFQFAGVECVERHGAAPGVCSGLCAGRPAGVRRAPATGPCR